VTDEKHALLACLEFQRAHVVGILAGLSEEELRREVLPSGWSALGLVQHLALEVERFWFRRVLAGETITADSQGEETSAWLVAADTTPEEIFDLYGREIERANAIIESTAIDAAPAWWPDYFDGWRLDDLRGILLHVIPETATHAGHLDAVRELIDERTWLRLT
jgi:hypothetical protein